MPAAPPIHADVDVRVLENRPNLNAKPSIIDQSTVAKPFVEELPGSGDVDIPDIILTGGQDSSALNIGDSSELFGVGDGPLLTGRPGNEFHGSEMGMCTVKNK